MSKSRTSLFLLASLSLTGCALRTTGKLEPTTAAVAGTAISGVVHGGSQPIYGANVYLLAMNPTGYGGPGIAASASNASISLLNAASTGNAADSIGSFVLTNNTTGGFSVSSDYACTAGFAQTTAAAVTLSGSEQVYLYVLGGTPQNANGANTSSGMLVALGPCNAPTTQVAINEITTLATAYAFAGFATDATHIGSSGTALALTGLTNAFANVANLATVYAGTVAGSITGITRPSANVITIADILAACVDGTTANSNCGTLFQYTASSGATGTPPTDTATAAINLAHNPWPTAAGMTALYGLVPGTGAPFVGGSSSQPNDFTLGLTLSGGGAMASRSLAIDASGNVWAGNVSTSSLSKFSSSGTAISSSSGYTGGGISSPYSVAIDASGNVWTANYGNNSLSEFSNAGTALSGSSGYTGGGIVAPYSVAIDATGNLWTANIGSHSLSKLSSSGTAISGSSGYTGGGINSPLAIAIDVSGNVWASGTALSELSNSGTPISGVSGYTGGGTGLSFSLAMDASGNVWESDYSANTLSEFSGSGSAISPSSGYSGGGINSPFSIAIDPAGIVWTSNYSANSVTPFNSSGAALSNANGYTGGNMNHPEGIAIDGSGNVWLANLNGSSLTELIGAASPVVTPMVANLLAPYGTSKVNRP